MNPCKLTPVVDEENRSPNECTDRENILTLLDKILAYHYFRISPILSKFLSYIVQETLAGNADILKEYTIALHVLNKPVHFSPHADCIVRVHAFRLRRALDQYYKSVGSDDELIISIPSGRYVPLFLPKKRKPEITGKLKSVPAWTRDKINMAILPFKTAEKNISKKTFVDSLGQKLSVDLRKTLSGTMISYKHMKELDEQPLTLNQVAAGLNLHYLLSGDVYFEGKKIRVFVQLIDPSTTFQIWSDVFHFTRTQSGYFELSDIVTTRIMHSLQSRYLPKDLDIPKSITQVS